MAVHKKNTGIEENYFRNLLFFLLIYIFGSPFLIDYPSLSIFAHVSLTLSLFVAVYTIHKQNRGRSVAMILLLPMLVLYWLGIDELVRFSRPGSYLVCAIYFGMLIYSYIVQIARLQRVTVNVLYMVFCLYLIIGLLWGSLYAMFYELVPGAYSGVLLEDVQGGTLHIFNYFSMVTLTTLGYGDIVPQTPGAASLCQMEAIVGQFFTAVLVAWFVGMYMFDKQDKVKHETSELRK